MNNGDIAHIFDPIQPGPETQGDVESHWEPPSEQDQGLDVTRETVNSHTFIAAMQQFSAGLRAAGNDDDRC